MTRRHGLRFAGHWYNPADAGGLFPTPADLPNVLGSGFQNPGVALGDLAWVTGGNTPGVYECHVGTLGAAEWDRVSPFNLEPNGEGYNSQTEIRVGTAEFPAEFAAGGGDSYSDDVLIYTETELGVFADVSALNGTGPITFPGVVADNAIYLGSDKQVGGTGEYLTFPGTKVAVSVAAVMGAGAFVAEYWNGAAWAGLLIMSTHADPDYENYNGLAFERVENDQIRFAQSPISEGLWTKNDPPGLGTDRFWMRYRIATGITTSPTITQFKLHTDRVEINEDGYIELFGTARVLQPLPWDIGLLQPASASPLNQDVFRSQGLDVGRVENKYANGATDRSGFVTLMPGNTCTSCPAILTWAYITDSASAGNIRWVVRWGWNTDGDNVYRTSGAAPATGPNEQETVLVTAAPVAVDTQQSNIVQMNIEGLVPARVPPLVGDSLWVTLERTGGDAADTHLGDVSIIQLNGQHVIWALGGFIG